MSEVYDRQKDQERIQRSQEFLDVFSKVVSGKANYRSVVDTKPIEMDCRKCGEKITDKHKFCPKCGTKVVVKPTHCPQCSKEVSQSDNFCQECGKNLEE